MEDTDTMPFGKYRGTQMADVPAGYLLWLNDNGSAWVRREYPQVFEYISDNLIVLMQESK